MKRIATVAAFVAAAGMAHAGGQVTQGQAGASPSIQTVIVPNIGSPGTVPPGQSLGQALRDFYGNEAN